MFVEIARLLIVLLATGAGYGVARSMAPDGSTTVVVGAAQPAAEQLGRRHALDLDLEGAHPSAQQAGDDTADDIAGAGTQNGAQDDRCAPVGRDGTSGAVAGAGRQQHDEQTGDLDEHGAKVLAPGIGALPVSLNLAKGPRPGRGPKRGQMA